MSYFSGVRSEAAHEAASEYDYDFIQARKYAIDIYEGTIGRMMTTNELDDLEGILELICNAEKKRRTEIATEQYANEKSDAVL